MANYASSYRGQDYAGFWRRASAITLDGLFFSLVILAFVLPLELVGVGAFGALTKEHPTTSVKILNYALGIAFVALVSLFESSRYQATPGKLLLGLRVVDIRGERIRFLRAFGRNIARLIPMFVGIIVLLFVYALGKVLPSSIDSALHLVGIVIFIIGGIITGVPWITIPFLKTKQGIHDLISRCLVVQGEKARAYRQFERVWMATVFGVLGFVIVGGIVVCAVTPAKARLKSTGRTASVVSAVENQPARSMAIDIKLDNSKASGARSSDPLGEIEGMLKTKSR